MIFLIKSTESRDANELLGEYPALAKYGSAHITTLDTSIEIYYIAGENNYDC